MTLQLQTQTTCFPAIEFKQYSVWDDVLIILTLTAYLILYIGCAYYLLYVLKLITNGLKKYLSK